MITVTNNKLSFLQWAKGNTAPDCIYPTPFNDNGDLRFQLVMEGAEIDAALAATLTVYFLPGDFTPTNYASLNANKIAIHSSAFASVKLSNTKAVWYITNKVYDDTQPNTLPSIGECFKIAVSFGVNLGEGTPPYWLSSCLQRVAVSEFSSILEYKCNENAYGFYYCNADIKNRVRLPLWLFQPQYKDDEEIYFNSDGVADVLSSLTREEFSGETDHLERFTHLKIKALLSHDIITITSDEYIGGIVKNGDYDIDWPKVRTAKIAKAGFKIFTTPFLVRNDNCQECEEFGDCEVMTGIEHSTIDNGNGTQTTTFNWNNSGLEKVQSVIIAWKPAGSGDPFTEVGGSKVSPRTLTLPIGLYDVKFISVGSGLEDGCNTDETGTIEVGELCVGVAITATELPDARSGVAYDETIPITGTGPFEISSIVKPSWMTVAIDGSNVRLTGTPAPGDVTEETTVSFTVSNCDGEETADYSDGIAVLASVGVVRITNSNFGSEITDVTGITGFTFDTDEPVGSGESQEGPHDDTTGSITIVVGGTLGANPGNLTVSVEGVVIDCQTITGAGTYILGPVAATDLEDINIALNMGACP